MKKITLTGTLALLLIGSLLTGCAGETSGSPGTEAVSAAGETDHSDPVQEVNSFGMKTPAVLDVVITDGNGVDGMLAARILEGVLNMGGARVYLAPSEETVDGVNIEKTKQKILKDAGVRLNKLKYDDSFGSEYAAFGTLFAKYGGELTELYVYDTALPDTANVAAMMASGKHGAAVSTELYNKMKAKGCSLPAVVITDFCGFGAGTTSAEINRWIGENMVEGRRRDMVFCLKPDGRSGPTDNRPAAYDLAAAMNAVIYFVDPRDADSMEAQRQILDQFDDNIPVLGWSGWEVERDYVSTISSLGKYVVCIDWGGANFSVWASFPEYAADQPVSAIPDSYETEDGAVYVSFMMSDGDAWHYCSKELISSWESDLRGDFPIAWTLPSLFTRFNPLTLRYLYGTATKSDAFLQGPSGIGYMYPSLYPEEAYPGFLEQTKAILKQAGFTMVNYWDLSDNNAMTGKNEDLKEEYMMKVDPDALLLGHSSRTGKAETFGDVVMIEEVGNNNGAGARTAADIVNAIDTAVRNSKGKTVFLLINVEAWGERLPAAAAAVDEIESRNDGKTYSFITVPEMVAAIRSMS